MPVNSLCANTAPVRNAKPRTCANSGVLSMPRNLMTTLPKLTEWERYLLSNLIWTYREPALYPSNDHVREQCSDLAQLALTDRGYAIACIKMHIATIEAKRYPDIAPPFIELLAKLEESK